MDLDLEVGKLDEISDCILYKKLGASLIAQLIKNPLAVQ